MIGNIMRDRSTLGTRGMDRRQFVGMAALAAGVAAAPRGMGADVVEMPFENGSRELVQYPQKRPLIRLTARPPQLETPMSVFNEGLLTPNDAFFVRYHLSGSPPAQELLGEGAFTVSVAGAVERPLEVTVAELRRRFETSEVVAVNQCSGNGRGLFVPRVPGGQSGNGAMGCARWRGVRLADVLKAAAAGGIHCNA